jgi:ribosome-associated protein
LRRPVIEEEELRFAYSRSSGPGGQHVNRVETRVTLLFDLAGSPSLSDEQKRRVRRRLATRINKEGVLRVVSQRHRTREANRRAAIGRFEELLAEAVRPPRPRRKTRVPAATKRRRVEAKRRRGEVKRSRGRPGSWDD